MVAAAFASTSSAAAAAAYSSLAPNPTARDPVRRRTPSLVTATNRHVHGRTATSIRQARPHDRFVNPPRPLFAAAAAAAEAEEMAAETSTGTKPFAVLFVCLGKSRDPRQSPPLSERPYQLIRVASCAPISRFSLPRLSPSACFARVGILRPRRAFTGSISTRGTEILSRRFSLINQCIVSTPCCLVQSRHVGCQSCGRGL
jgi:hypothetical protein